MGQHNCVRKYHAYWKVGELGVSVIRAFQIRNSRGQKVFFSEHNEICTTLYAVHSQKPQNINCSVYGTQRNKHKDIHMYAPPG